MPAEAAPSRERLLERLLSGIERRVSIGRDQDRRPVDPTMFAAVERLEVQMRLPLKVSHSSKVPEASKVQSISEKLRVSLFRHSGEND